MHGETTPHTSPTETASMDAAPIDAQPTDAADSTTSREVFRQLAAEHRVVPVTRKVLADSETPLSAYRKLGMNGLFWPQW